jgi:hypothetical protein
MTNRTSDNPWRSLAAEVVLRAKADIEGRLHDVHNDFAKALIQYDAEEWVEHDPWCQCLLDSIYPDKNIEQASVAKRWRYGAHRISYRKYLPEVRMTAWLTVTELCAATGLSNHKIRKAINDNRLHAEKRVPPKKKAERWHTTLAELAKAVTRGKFPLVYWGTNRRKAKRLLIEEPPYPERRMEEGKGSYLSCSSQ